MQMTQVKKSLSLIVCTVLIAAMALSATGCTDSKETNAGLDSTEATMYADGSEIGQGETSFTFTVTDGEGNEATYEINTDEETVGEALLALGLIDGEEGPYGLYVKTVNGITVDFDKDGKYWAFYVDGAYAQTGVDSTIIVEGSTYSFKVE